MRTLLLLLGVAALLLAGCERDRGTDDTGVTTPDVDRPALSPAPDTPGSAGGTGDMTAPRGTGTTGRDAGTTGDGMNTGATGRGTGGTGEDAGMTGQGTGQNDLDSEGTATAPADDDQ